MDSSVTNNLVIGTFNIKNVETNILFTNKLLKKVDILFLQETWLFNFQLPLLQEYFSSHISCGKAVDDENPLPPTQKPRGYGGVACMVRKDLDIRYKFHSNGGNRIMILEVQTEPPLCIIGVYMPVRGTTKNRTFKKF